MKPVDGLPIAHVDLVRRRRTTVRPDRHGHGRRRTDVGVSNDHVSALGGQPVGDRLAQPGPATRDDCRPVDEAQ